MGNDAERVSAFPFGLAISVLSLHFHRLSNSSFFSINHVTWLESSLICSFRDWKASYSRFVALRIVSLEQNPNGAIFTRINRFIQWKKTDKAHAFWQNDANIQVMNSNVYLSELLIHGFSFESERRREHFFCLVRVL